MESMGYYTNRQLMDRYSSLDGSDDTFLSCNTHPFPSQGSLAGLEELAAKGSMAANGSMPAVNISVLNSIYMNPMGRPGPNRRSPDSPAQRRVRIATCSRQPSSDNESWADCLEEIENGSGFAEDEPKHRRTRMAQVKLLLQELFIRTLFASKKFTSSLHEILNRNFVSEFLQEPPSAG